MEKSSLLLKYQEALARAEAAEATVDELRSTVRQLQATVVNLQANSSAERSHAWDAGREAGIAEEHAIAQALIGEANGEAMHAKIELDEAQTRVHHLSRQNELLEGSIAVQEVALVGAEEELVKLRKLPGDDDGEKMRQQVPVEQGVVDCGTQTEALVVSDASQTATPVLGGDEAEDRSAITHAILDGVKEDLSGLKAELSWAHQHMRRLEKANTAGMLFQDELLRERRNHTQELREAYASVARPSGRLGGVVEAGMSRAYSGNRPEGRWIETRGRGPPPPQNVGPDLSFLVAAGMGCLGCILYVGLKWAYP